MRQAPGQTPFTPDGTGFVHVTNGVQDDVAQAVGVTPGGPNGAIQFNAAGSLAGFGVYDPVLKNILLDASCSVLDPADTHGAFAGGNASTVGDLVDMTGQYAFAYGDRCAARGDYSIAMGHLSNAEGQASISMGFGSLVSGQGAVGIGFGAIAIGAVAMALGDGSQANGVGALGFTEDNVADFDHATALGEGSLATRYGMIAECSLSTDNPQGTQKEYLFAHLAAAPGNLLLHNATLPTLPNGLRGLCIATVIVCDTASNTHSAFQFLLAYHTQASHLVIDQQTPLITFNPSGFALTFPTDGTLNFHAHVDPGAFTVNAFGFLQWINLPGIP